MKIDVLASGRYNGRPVVFVFEVKSSLESRHGDEFLSDLRCFKRFFPEYAGYLIYGGVAGMTMVIVNKKTFRPPHLGINFCIEI